LNLATLRSRIAGTVVERGAPDYPKVRDAMLWNELKPQRSPELIVRVRSAADVAAAIVRWSRARMARREQG